MRSLYLYTDRFFIMKNLIVYIFVFFTLSVAAQNDVILKGSAIDSLKQPIESATVYLSKAKDSTLIEYTMTDVKGFFELKVKKRTDPVVLKISMLGYREYTKYFDEGLDSSVDFGNLILQDLSTNLDELVITAEVPPIRIKKDTLEFNASSFKVRPDANLEELLKQLPGIQIDEEKKISINGKQVSEILVNGKPFFGEDGQIALENIPSEIINKVQVTDKKSKKQKFTGERSTSNDASINITIDENKNKGYFGKISGGYGTDDRYESSLFLNYFNNARKISVIGSANNINAIGFSMDDIFDNMQSGKNSRGGITESRILGFNYGDDFTDKLKINGSYNYNKAETENWNNSAIVKFLPSGEFNNQATSVSENESEGHRANFTIDYIGEKDALYITPQFSENHNHSFNESNQVSTDAEGVLLNDSEVQSRTEGKSFDFGNTIRYTRKFKKDGQFLTLGFSNSNRTKDNETLYESETRFYQSEKENDVRRQFKNNKSHSDNYTVDAEYNQPITDSLALGIGAKWTRGQNIEDLQVFDFDETSQMYSEINKLETNKFNTTQNKIAPFTKLTYIHKKFFVSASTDLNIVKNSATAEYFDQNYSLDKYYMDPSATLFFNYRIDKQKFLWLSYNYNVSYQSASQLLDITDISNPLNTIVGNPDLKPTGTHGIQTSFRSYDFEKREGYNLNISASVFNNQVTSSVEYDDDMKSISTFKNISGSYNWSLGGDWYKNYKWEEHVLRIGFGARFNQSVSKGYIDGAMYDSKSSSISPRVYLNYDYGEFLTVRPSYNYSSYTSKYNNFTVDKATNFVHNFNLQTTTYWPSNVILGNDFGYSYNSQIAKGYQRSFYMWNLSLAYEFLDKKMRARIKVYDVLNQNTSSTRTIDPTQIVDQESLVLKRYIMFSLIYKLNEFGGKDSKMRANRGGGRIMRM